MAKFFRLVFMTLAIVAVSLTAALQQPDWASDLHLDAWWLGMGIGTRPVLPVDERDIAILQRITEKQRITEDLLEGQLTLFEAADQFQRLDAADPQGVNHPEYIQYPFDERACRQVIAWAHQLESRRDREAANSRAARFEEELRRHKAQEHDVQATHEVDTE